MATTATKPNGLTAAFVSSAKQPGKYHDGKGTGLFLLVKPTGGRFWVQRLDDTPRPSSLMAMTSAGYGGERFDLGKPVEGYFRVQAPYFSELSEGSAWASIAPPDVMSDPGLHGNVRPVADRRVVGVFLDGHAEAIDWDRVTSDMTLWAPRAESPSYRVELKLR